MLVLPFLAHFRAGRRGRGGPAVIAFVAGLSPGLINPVIVPLSVAAELGHRAFLTIAGARIEDIPCPRYRVLTLATARA